LRGIPDEPTAYSRGRCGFAAALCPIRMSGQPNTSRECLQITLPAGSSRAPRRHGLLHWCALQWQSARRSTAVVDFVDRNGPRRGQRVGEPADVGLWRTTSGCGELCAIEPIMVGVCRWVAAELATNDGR
jgi:hypothetical protein